jgi:SAM-dependent methyltransferase
MSDPATTIRYEANVDAGQRNTSHIQIAELVAQQGQAPLRILEVGCSSGYLGCYLRSQGHRVAGIEPAAAAAAAARAVLDDVFTGNLDEYLACGGHADGFDVIVLADVLEHLEDPARALTQCRSLLASGGALAISVPNITHGGVRGMLLEGRWTYQDLGILDRTHLRNFSRAGFIDLLDAAAFELAELRATTMSIEAMNSRYGIGLSAGTMALIKLTARDYDLDSFQFVALARPAPDVGRATSANARWRSGRLISAAPSEPPMSRWRKLRRRWRARANAVRHLLAT